MKKLLIRGSLIVLALIVVLVVVFIFTIDSIAKSAIASAGTSALGVKTSVGKVSIGIFSGRSEITDLAIKNPEGFTGDFLDLSDGVLDVSLGSLLTDKVKVKEIALDGLSVEFLQKLDGSNVSIILDNVDKATGDDESKDQKETDSSEKKFVIDQLKVTKIKVTIGIEPLSSATKPSTLTIDEIVVNDIGKKENGVTLDEVSGVVVQAIVHAVLKAAPGQIPSVMFQGIEGGLSNLTHLDFGSVQFDAGKGLSKIAEGLGSLGKHGGKGISDALDNIGQGISDALDKGTKDSDSDSEDSKK
jgi:hypothetical protein